mgnify:CR=1 FL=1
MSNVVLKPFNREMTEEVVSEEPTSIEEVVAAEETAE